MAYARVQSITISAAWAVGSLSDVDFLFSGTWAIYKSVANGGFIQSASGFDIGFFEDAACTQPLDWEIEKWDPVTGEIVAWMRLPAVVVATQTVVYAALGDPAIVTNLANPHSLWFNNGFGSGWRFVYHLAEGAEKLTDSTQFMQTLTPIGAPPTIAAQIDGGVSLDGATQYFTASGLGMTQVTGILTLSCWFYPTSFAAGTLIQKQVNFLNYKIGMDATGHVVGGANTRDFAAAVSAAPMTLNAWNFLEAGWQGGLGNPQPNFVTLNGVLTNGVDPYDSGGYTGLSELYIGSSADPIIVLPGRLDEVRLTTTPWTQPRTTMTYTNQVGTVFTFNGGLPGVAGCVVTL